MKTPTASQILCTALGVTQDGVPAKAEGLCAYCGTAIAAGDLCAPFSPGESFTNGPDLAARGSPVACAACAYFVGNEGLRASQNGVYSAAGVLPFRKWADVRRALLDPPEPPFVMLYATAKNQHMAWRAAVNTSRDRFTVRVGQRDLVVDREKLPRLVDACAVVQATIERYRIDKAVAGLSSAAAASRREKAEKEAAAAQAKRTMRPHPFVGFAADLKEPKTGVLRMDLAKLDALSNDPAYHAALTLLQQMTLGDGWALTFALSTKQ